MEENIETVKETPTKDVLYETLDRLILQAEEMPKTERRKSADPSSDVVSADLIDKIESWPEQSIEEMASLCDEVLADLDAQYALSEKAKKFSLFKLKALAVEIIGMEG